MQESLVGAAAAVVEYLVEFGRVSSSSPHHGGDRGDEEAVGTVGRQKPQKQLVHAWEAIPKTSGRVVVETG